MGTHKRWWNSRDYTLAGAEGSRKFPRTDGETFENRCEWNVLLFLQTNTWIDYQTLWDNSSYSNTTNVYLHKSTVRDLVQHQYFRSPLIESWQRLDVQKVKVTLHDSYGHDLIAYTFDGSNTTTTSWFSEPLIVSNYNLDSDSYEVKEGIKHSRDDPGDFWFLSLRGSLSRRHFVLFSPNETSFHMPLIDPFCSSNYTGEVVASTENVTSYGDCVIFCYSTAATMAVTASMNNSEGKTCECLVNFTTTEIDDDVNNTNCGRACLWNTSVPCADHVYKAVSNISSFEDCLMEMTQQTESVTYDIDNTDIQVVDFGSKTILTSITVTSDNGCQLNFRYAQFCNQSTGTDSVILEAKNITVGTNSTTYVSFLAVRCIEMKNDVVNSTCRVIIEKQTGFPSFAPAISISASWQNEICQFANIMMPNLMTSSNVQLYNGEVGDSSPVYAALRLDGAGLSLKLTSWPLPETRIVVRRADQYNSSVLLQRIEIVGNISSVYVKLIRCDNATSNETVPLYFQEEVQHDAVTIWISNSSSPICIRQYEITLPSLTGVVNEASSVRSLRMGLFGCLNTSYTTTCSVTDLFTEEFFPSNRITIYNEQEGFDMTSIGTCGEGLQVPVSDVIGNPVFYIKLVESPQTFILVDRVMLLGASLTADISAAAQENGTFQVLNTTTFTSGVIAEFQSSIHVHTLQVSTSHTDFKMEIWACILNMEIMQNGNTFDASTSQCSDETPPDVTGKTSISKQEAEKRAEEYRKILEVNHRTLSSFVRSKTSASDDRSSSKAIGTLGAILLTFIVGFIVAMDIPRFLIFSREICTALKRKLAVNE